MGVRKGEGRGRKAKYYIDFSKKNVQCATYTAVLYREWSGGGEDLIIRKCI